MLSSSTQPTTPCSQQEMESEMLQVCCMQLCLLLSAPPGFQTVTAANPNLCQNWNKSNPNKSAFSSVPTGNFKRNECLEITGSSKGTSSCTFVGLRNQQQQVLQAKMDLCHLLSS